MPGRPGDAPGQRLTARGLFLCCDPARWRQNRKAFPAIGRYLLFWVQVDEPALANQTSLLAHGSQGKEVFLTRYSPRG